MRALLLIASVAIATPALAGCGGGGQSLDTPKAIADQLGCASSYQDVSTDELGVDQAGRCRFHGQTVRLLTFASNDARDTFSQIAGSFGGRYVQGDGYLIEVKGPEAQKAAEDKLS